ncbi:hypothetical protein QTP88_026543 [Uroleucon formosanum]
MSSTTKDKKDKQLPDKRSMTTLPKLSNNSTNDKWIKTKKRNLSSSNSDTTLSPKVQHKKKLFSSPNRFELLSAAETSNEDIIIDESQPTTSVSVYPANQPPPPIFIKGVDFLGLCTELINLIGVDNFYCKSTTDKLKIQTLNPDSYRTVVHFLRREKAQFHTYQLNEDKPTRVVLRNLHPSTPTELIKSELEVRLFESAAWAATKLDKPPHTYSNFQLVSEQIRSLIVEKRRARARYQSSRLPSHKSAYNKLTNSLKKVLAKHKTNEFEQKLQSLSSTDGSLWKETKRMLKYKTPSCPLKNADNTLAITDDEKSTVFQSHLYETFQPHNDILIPQHSENVERYLGCILVAVMTIFEINGYNSCGHANLVFSDFEQAIHTAIKDVWPTTNLKACRFHLGQAWFRKMQSLGLAKPYMKPGEMSEYLKLFFGLPFLRPDEVDDCFVTDIMALLPPNNSKLTAFTDYILEVYVREDSRYPPSLWAECSSSITRTTNACESFHSKLNSMFYHSHPNIFIFVDALNEIQTNGYLKINCTETSSVNKISIEKERFLAQQIRNIQCFYDSVNNDDNDYLRLSDHSGLDESTLPNLNVEYVKSNEPTLSGRRVVDIEHFMKQMMELGKHGSKCTMGRFVLIKEVQNGVGFNLYFKCHVCDRHQIVTSDRESSVDNVNNALVWGALSIGIGHRQIEDLLAVMDCPSPSFKKFKRHEVIIGKVWEQQISEMLKKNGEQEKKIAIQKGNLYKGTPYITVIGDGGWAKRSYGHGFNSQSGVVILEIL